MTDTLQVKTYAPPPVDEREILRYAACPEPAPETLAVMRECLSRLEDKLAYKVVFRYFPAHTDGESCDLGFCTVRSRDLARILSGCRGVVLFAATIGIAVDREILRESALSPVRALFYQAIGTERIEALCDVFNAEITHLAQAEGMYTKPRFSPGYGDLPIELQRGIFSVLDCPRKIGVSLNASLLMSPSKSVTAIIGIGERKD